MYRLNSNIVVLLISCFLFNCNSSDQSKSHSDKSNKSISNNPYFPLSKGYIWEYVNAGERKESELFKVEVLSIKKDGNDKIVEMSSFPFFSKKEENTKLKVKDDGSVYVMSGQTEDLCIPSTNNIKNGYNWNFAQWYGSCNTWKDTTKTENGTYSDCFFLNYSISITFSAEIWVSKNTGIVKWGYNRTNPPTFNPDYYVLNKMSTDK